MYDGVLDHVRRQTQHSALGHKPPQDPVIRSVLGFLKNTSTTVYTIRPCLLPRYSSRDFVSFCASKIRSTLLAVKTSIPRAVLLVCIYLSWGLSRRDHDCPVVDGPATLSAYFVLFLAALLNSLSTGVERSLSTSLGSQLLARLLLCGRDYD